MNLAGEVSIHILASYFEKEKAPPLIASEFEFQLIEQANDLVTEFIAQMQRTRPATFALLHEAEQRDEEYEFVMATLNQFIEANNVEEPKIREAESMRERLTELKDQYNQETENYPDWSAEYDKANAGATSFSLAKKRQRKSK